MTKSTPRQAKQRSKKTNDEIAMDAGTHLDQVREILFGKRITLFEERLQRLEKQLLQEHAELRDATDARFEAIESHIRQELETLSTRLDSEGAKRTEALKRLTQELRETARTLEKQVGKLDEGATKMASDLRQHTTEQVKALSGQLREQTKALSALLERRFEELREEKTDRESLAALFAEMATRLSDTRSPTK